MATSSSSGEPPPIEGVYTLDSCDASYTGSIGPVPECEGGHCECHAAGAPWGAPERIADARAILEQTRLLLELLQAAHRDGLLGETGLSELVTLARFYTALQRQLQEPR